MVVSRQMMALPEMFGWVGSAIAFWAFMKQVLPREYTDYIADWILNFVSPYSYFEVFDMEADAPNKLYGLVNTYLSSVSSYRTRRSRLLIPKSANSVTVGLSKHEYVYDTFNGMSFRWENKTTDRKSPIHTYGIGSTDEKRLFELKFLRKDKDEVLGAYISHVMNKGKSIARDNKEIRLFSNKKGRGTGYSSFFSARQSLLWDSIPFRHPATFDTIALDPEKKQSIIDDLDEFVRGKDFYRRVGKAWKRGYLLYGPPGTGKTSILAAMANKLRYNIYDLELTEVESNAQLRDLLVYTESKSIIVIEDIDCSLDLSGQRKKKAKKDEPAPPPPPPVPGQPPPKKREDDAPSKVTLSGLLNFTDGLWSCCEDERIFVFTTNFVNKLDPALLRSGRMDMHINLSYCTFIAFKTLATNILQTDHHALYPQVEELINEGTRIAPSEVAEVLTKNRKSAENAMEELIERLEKRKANPLPREPRPEDYKAEDDEDDNSNPPDETTNTAEKVAGPKPNGPAIKVETTNDETSKAEKAVRTKPNGQAIKVETTNDETSEAEEAVGTKPNGPAVKTETPTDEMSMAEKAAGTKPNGHSPVIKAETPSGITPADSGG